jgi:hypothetical protein
VADYFFGLHFSQSAQVLPVSVQHFMVQVGFLAQHLLHEAQPVNQAAVQASATHRTISFTFFIIGVCVVAIQTYAG